jgi:hypothetical protein
MRNMAPARSAVVTRPDVRRPLTLRRAGLAAALCAASAVLAAAADDPLAKARTLYNQRQFDASIVAAEQARLAPTHADAADLVAARAYLERFRESAASDDLVNARDRLRRISPEHFVSSERAEYLIGLGEALFLEDGFGAAASVFDSVLQGADLKDGPGREHVLDWWATAVDRDARPRSDIDRQAIYQHLRARLEDELAAHPGSGAASYWLAAAARWQGDLHAAWDAAQAGWVRAPLAADHGAALRADLDRLVLRVIIPERAKLLAQPPDSLRTEWERFKIRWMK